jgi:hypothetical protein
MSAGLTGAQRTLESIVDPFVKRAGGERVSEIVGNNNPQSSADYLFQHFGVIAELTSLQAGRPERHSRKCAVPRVQGEADADSP